MDIAPLSAVIVSIIAALVSVYNAYSASQNIKKQTELAQEKQKDEHKATNVTNTEKLQDMYQQAFGDFEQLWKKRLADQAETHEQDITALRNKLQEQYTQKEQILLFRVADLKGQIERLHGIVEGATGRNMQAYMKRASDYVPEKAPPLEKPAETQDPE